MSTILHMLLIFWPDQLRELITDIGNLVGENWVFLREFNFHNILFFIMFVMLFPMPIDSLPLISIRIKGRRALEDQGARISKTKQNIGQWKIFDLPWSGSVFIVMANICALHILLTVLYSRLRDNGGDSRIRAKEIFWQELGKWNDN